MPELDPIRDGAPDSNACEEYNALSRRRFMLWSGAATAAAFTTPLWFPRVTFARFPSSRDVIVSVFLRGACDGLTMCVPYGDAAYYTARPSANAATPGIGVPPPGSVNGCTDLNGFFGLPPGMANLYPIYQAGHLAIVHATGSTDPSRSHFDAQKFMEVGKPADPNIFTGWLGRHIASVNPADPTATVRAIGIGYQMPLTLAGSLKGVPVPDLSTYNITGSSATRTARLGSISSQYATQLDPVKTASANTLATIAAMSTVGAGSYVPPTTTFPYPPTSGTGRSTFALALKQTAALIRADIGVEAVAIDKSGWDTHSAQGVVAGTMHTNMLDLANTLRAFYEDVAIDAGRNVTIVVMSEFGRRVAQNASLGTDHGHGNVMLVIGRKINGGQVVTQWPGLGAGQLYQNLDLNVTIDFRDILAEIVNKRLENGNLANVFPGYTPTFRNIAVAG
ncbi:MAG TPA: DUF1501 domain-containing protein [Phycisphaerales bacterium]|nr:DUF1501 domain-containing protein [Phycisphaerales bacterium]